MADRSGQQLDHYHLLRLLGRGTFGEVYLAENTHHKTRVAVKVLHMRLNKDEFYTFINEARVFRLRHPHIVPILDFGVDRSTDTPFLVMDYAPNGTLRQRHSEGSQLTLPTVVEYVRQVAGALQHAHEENLVHRDVKPENLLVGAKNEILLSDFGVAVVTQSARNSIALGQKMAGTVDYMAPEQFLGKPGRASDQYALAVIVYEWLSGKLPFQGTLYEVMGQHVQAAPPPLPQSLQTYSPDLEQIIMKALAKEPRDRFASIQEFATKLEEFCGQKLAVQLAPPVSLKTKRQYLDEGNMYLETQNHEGALDAYSQAIRLNPNDPIVYLVRGLIYSGMQQYRQAIADFNHAVMLSPHDVLAYSYRGLVYYYLEKYQRAIVDFNRALELLPNDALIHLHRGLAYHRLEQYQKAIGDYDRSIQLRPDHAPAYYHRGLAYSYLRGYQQAIPDFERTIELDPHFVAAYSNRGYCYDHLQEYQKAIEDYNRVLELEPKGSTATIAYRNREEAVQKLKKQLKM